MYINCFFIKNWRLESIYFDKNSEDKYVDSSGFKQILVHQIMKVDGEIIIDD